MSDEVPSGWARTTVGAVCDWPQYGWTTSASFDAVGPKLLRSTDISGGSVNWSDVPFCQTPPPSIEKYQLHHGDIVITRTGAGVGNSFLIERCPLAVFASYLIRFKPHHLINPKYVAYFLKSPSYWGVVSLRSAGIAQPNVNAQKLASIEVPLAARSEQNAIVAEIEKQFTRLDAAVAALKRVQANLKRYRAAVLKAACEGRLVPTEAELARKEGRSYETGNQLLARLLKERRAKWESDQFSKIHAGRHPKDDSWKKKYKEPRPPDTSNLPLLPEGWTWATADQLCLQVTDGEHIQPPYQPEGRPMLSAMHVRDGWVELTGFGRISEEAFSAAVRRCAPERGDILIVSVGATTGRPALVQIEEPFAIVRSVLLLKPSKPVRGEFFLNWIRSPWCQEWIRTASGASAQAHFYISDAKRMPVPLPPEAEMARISEKLEDQLSFVFAVGVAGTTNFVRADRLRQSILKRAFEGKLVPQDPNDEPATALLERIRAERESRQDQSFQRRSRQAAQRTLLVEGE